MDINRLANQQNICFVLPTYNEEGTIERIIAQIKAEETKQNIYSFSILVVDDNSIDKTQDIVKRVIDSTENIYLITGQKKGLGDAYKRGFLFALETLEAGVIFQMDSDGQHEASSIPDFLKEVIKTTGNEYASLVSDGVEAGDVETVIKNPKHPYTQLLIDSIPEADPGKKWGKLDMQKTQKQILTSPSVGWRK